MDEPAPELIQVDKKEKPHAPHLAILLAAINTVQGWLLLFFFPFNLPITILLHYFTHRYSRTTNVVSVFLQPYLVLTVIGVIFTSVGYLDGSAEFCLAPHKTDFGTYSSHFGTRTQGLQSDLFLPIMFLTTTVTDLTLYWNCLLFGPVKNNYTGPLPTVEQAILLADTKSTSIPETDFESMELKVNGRVIGLTEEALLKCQKLFELHPPGYTEYFHDPALPYEVTLYDKDCLIVRSRTSEGDAFITLIDASTGRFIEQVVTLTAGRHFR